MDPAERGDIWRVLSKGGCGYFVSSIVSCGRHYICPLSWTTCLAQIRALVQNHVSLTC